MVSTGRRARGRPAAGPDEAIPSIEADPEQGVDHNQRRPAVDPFYVPLPLDEVWHRHMPAKFPFGETATVAEHMSREMEVTLKQGE